MAKVKCAYCGKEIDTKKESHYKFGKDIVCYNEEEATCITPYAWEHLVDLDNN
ncbi:hypothetical protein SAMN04487895_101688 [Paenibacillus sophorae]|uniref:Uncharacterized protein n=1 Tax=Paenibacillus sophorae TaxID=1333845 RepID=A0A1H8GYB1_9BACL|nr:hypothetical protein [Paenibacillus sophorae]QWU14381.1 hypothetical protein KP014_20965 [Paenibacillus sophorae]SEN48993.1 hypothetical protein SAMN04487895_101688 [Paenibacillus sophorae]